MKISELLGRKKTTLSLEIFPPKPDGDYGAVVATADKLCALKPDFMSVTYGAAGSTVRYTEEIAGHLQNDMGQTAIAHLTCVTATKQSIRDVAAGLRARGIENIMALRGDMPRDGAYVPGDYRYASDLVTDLKEIGGFCIGGACYPDGHIECDSREKDIDNLKRKVDAGCEFLTTQLFFDNNVFYNFLYRLASKGIFVPVLAGVMPITSAKQIKRMTALSGAHLSPRHRAIIDRFQDNPAALRQAGVAYATEQIIDLIASGVRGIHIYTMNRPEIAQAIVGNISEMLK